MATEIDKNKTKKDVMYEVEVIAESHVTFQISEEEAEDEAEAAEIAKQRAQKTTRRGSDVFRLAHLVRANVMGPDELSS